MVGANDWIPQFPDGSGWNLEFETSPCFYEHITRHEAKAFEQKEAKRLYKIVCLLPDPRPRYPYHKNTYFVKGSRLNDFVGEFSSYAEYIVSIEPVESMPSTDEKLSQ